MNTRIQALRGVSILLVLLQHGLLLDTFMPTGYLSPGWSGVHLFFVISGCVIADSLWRDNCHFGRFMIRRAFRLWPALIAFLVVVYILNQAFVGEPGYPFGARPNNTIAWYSAASLTGLVYPAMFFLIHPPVPYMFVHIWSLSVEDIFYLVLGIFAPLLLLRPRWGIVSGMLILLLCVSIGRIITSVISPYYDGDFAMVWQTPGIIGTVWTLTKTGIAFAAGAGMDFLIAGILVCLVARIRGQRRESAARRYAAWLDFLILFAALAILSASGNPPAAQTHPLFSTVGLPTALVGFSVVVYRSWCHKEPPAGIITHAFKHLGDLSYSLYLIHIPVAAAVSCLLYRVEIIWQHSRPTTFAIALFAIYAPVSYALALIANRWIEQPFIRRGKALILMRVAEPKPRIST